jgi:3-methyl-2-oxobutanoate hydroxymethyltransferase
MGGMKKVTLGDLRQARVSGRAMAMLTCYDFTTARLMREAEVPSLLVGDSAAMVVLGHDSTLPVPLALLMELTSAVRRGHPEALLLADMPFGSYHASTAQGVRNVCRMVQRTGCDLVKLEVARSHLEVISRCADGGIAVVAHLGLRPQAVGLLGGYKAQGRTEASADEIVELAIASAAHGAAAVLLEAVPPEVTRRVVEAVEVPVIGCGAGRHAHGHVVVTPDLLGLTGHRPRFVPRLADGVDVHGQTLGALRSWVGLVESGSYPTSEQEYAPAARSSATPG